MFIMHQLTLKALTANISVEYNRQPLSYISIYLYSIPQGKDKKEIYFEKLIIFYILIFQVFFLKIRRSSTAVAVLKIIHRYVAGRYLYSTLKYCGPQKGQSLKRTSLVKW